MRKGLWFLGAVFLAVALVFTAGCPAGDDVDDAFDWDGEIVMGLTAPLSGPGTLYGQMVLYGLLMAVDDINEAGGIVVDELRYKIRLHHLDDAYDPAAAVTNARRLVDDWGSNIVWCPHAGGILGIQSFNEEEDILVMGYTTFEYIINHPARGTNELTLRIPNPMGSFAEGMVEWAWERGNKTAATLPSAGVYGEMWRDTFTELFTAKGGEIVYDADVDYGAVDFSAYLTVALDSDPDVILIVGPSEPSALLAKQARDYGFEGDFVFGEQCKFDEMVKVVGQEPFKNSIGTGVPGWTTYKLERTEELAERYLARYPRIGIYGSEAALHYEAMWVLRDAIEKAGTFEDVRAIRAAFPEVLPRPVDQVVYPYLAVADDGSMLSPVSFMVMGEDAYFADPFDSKWPGDYMDLFVDFEEVGIGKRQPGEGPDPWREEWEKDSKIYTVK